MTVKTRITLFIVGAGIVTSLLFSVVVFYELIEQPFELLDHLLEEEAHRTVMLLVKSRQEPDAGYAGALARGLAPYWVEVVDKETRALLFRSDLAKRIKLSPVKPGGSAIDEATIPIDHSATHQDGPDEMAFRVRTFLVSVAGGTFEVQIARPMAKLEEEIWELVLGILSGILFSTLALIAISRFVAGKILQPIGQLTDLARDISEKNLDQRIPTGEERDEFSELARTVNRMLDRLQYSFKRQRDFLFDTSHELKTPLTTMRLAVDEICGGADPETPPSLLREKLLRLNNQVLRMERLVKNLLSLSSLEAASGLDRKPVPLTPLLSSLAEEYRFLADAHDITLEIHLPEALTIRGDAEKLHRAFSNILDNAVKYNVAGGRIEVTGDQTANERTVTVANTGPGVPESEIPKVFEQFYRVEKSRSAAHGGSGLGLAIVRKIIDLHGGNVDFESRQEGWTRVTVRLPAAA